jgi:hypothetical protein
MYQKKKLDFYVFVLYTMISKKRYCTVSAFKTLFHPSMALL